MPVAAFTGAPSLPCSRPNGRSRSRSGTIRSSDCPIASVSVEAEIRAAPGFQKATPPSRSLGHDRVRHRVRAGPRRVAACKSIAEPDVAGRKNRPAL